ncbi:MAG: hypothetical protein ABSF52_24190 [Syntrophobacteraceae bacterium]|jgi:hypothetical protein
MTWRPQNNEDVGPNEHIGRRIFDEPPLVGARDQKPLERLSIQHFEDKDGEVSLDRLGRTGIDKGVVGYLRRRADKAGTKFRRTKAFRGWAVLTARKFGSPPAPPGHALSVIASPVHGDDLDENIYHAYVVDPRKDRYIMALYLRELFENHGTVTEVK